MAGDRGRTEGRGGVVGEKRKNGEKKIGRRDNLTERQVVFESTVELILFILPGSSKIIITTIISLHVVFASCAQVCTN